VLLIFANLAHAAPQRPDQVVVEVDWTDSVNSLQFAVLDEVESLLVGGYYGAQVVDLITYTASGAPPVKTDEGVLDLRAAVAVGANYEEHGSPSALLVFGNVGVYDGQSGATLGRVGTVPLHTELHDASGDNRVDVCTTDGLLLTTTSGFTLQPAPNDLDPGFVGQHDFHACLPDMTGDGLGDLLMVHYDDQNLVFKKYLIGQTSGPVSLHPGGPDGYGAPLWSQVLFPEAIYSARSLQADLDPELELAVLGNYVDRLSFDIRPTSWLYIIDDVATSPRVRDIFPTPVGPSTPFDPLPQLGVVGDINDDGIDDIVLPEPLGASATGATTHHLRIVSGASTGYAPTTLATFTLDLPDPGTITRLVHHANDLDGDGHVDLYAAAQTASTTIQIWHGPLVEPPSAPADTSDTGVESGTDTDTDTGGSSTPPSPTVYAQPRRRSDAKGCHCSHGACDASFMPLSRRH